MRIKVQSDVDVRMPHDILQAFGIHIFACKPGAERVPMPYNKDKAENLSKIKGFRACPYSFSMKKRA